MPLSLLRGRGCSRICQLSRLQRSCRKGLASMMVASDHLISCPVSMACCASAEFMGLAMVRALLCFLCITAYGRA